MRKPCMAKPRLLPDVMHANSGWTAACCRAPSISRPCPRCGSISPAVSLSYWDRPRWRMRLPRPINCCKPAPSRSPPSGRPGACVAKPHAARHSDTFFRRNYMQQNGWCALRASGRSIFPRGCNGHIDIEENNMRSQPLSRILVVEDNVDSNEMLCELLRSLNHAADGVTSGEQALNLLKQRDFDIVIAD